jgi:hypothetical protein
MNDEETKQKQISLEEAIKISHGKDVAELDNLRERVLDIEKKAKDLDRISNFMLWVAGVVMVGFLFSLVLISLDYFKYNGERYENLMRETRSIRGTFLDREEGRAIEEKINKDSRILNCFKSKGYFSIVCY